ncbi:MAG: TraU family protein, partial [Helicobacter sp.]
PLPIWIKTTYRLQFMYPFPHPMAMGIGQTGVIWTPLKNLPAGGDNFNYLLFKKVDCCAL